MSKGYADYLLSLADEIDRAIQREIDGVEVPLFNSEYEEWLLTKKELKPESIPSYLYWLIKADSWICDLDHDFWTLLSKVWKSHDYDMAKKLCEDYESLLLEEKAQAKEAGDKEEFGETDKEIGNWVSAFRKYRKFLDEKIDEEKRAKHVAPERIEKARLTAVNLFLSVRFIYWCIANGLTEGTAQSYVSNIKRINREMFCKTGHDLLREYLPGFVKTGNAEKIDEMFNVMISKITGRIEKGNETEMSIEAYQNCRSALLKYKDFLKSIL